MVMIEHNSFAKLNLNALVHTILFIDIPNSRGLVLGETRSPYLPASVLRLPSTESQSLLRFIFTVMYVYEVFEDKTKKQCSLSIFLHSQ